MLRTEATDTARTLPRVFGVSCLLLGALLVLGCASESDWVEPDWAGPVYSEEEIKVLFAGTDFDPVRKVEDVPEPVQTASRNQDPTLTFFAPFMANPGEPFNWSDVKSPGLASKRLIFGGRSANRVFLYFEQGGYTGPVARCEAYEMKGATARQVPIENFWRNSKQDDLVYLRHLIQNWPEATQDSAASSPKRQGLL